MRFPNRSQLKQVLLFALAGPPTAALFWQIWANLAAEFPRQYTAGSWLSTWAGLSVFAYLWGFLPALLTGIAAAYLHTVAPGVGIPTRIARVAGIVTMGGIASWIVPRVFPGESDLTLAALGAGAALVYALWAERWVRPNNSFKPKPLRGSA